MDEKSLITIPQIIKEVRINAGKGEKQRIQVLSQLHNLQKSIPFVIGDLLLDWENKLKQNYISAKKHQEELGKQGKLPVKNLFEWFNANPDKLPFGYKAARQYISYRSDREEILLKAPEKLEHDISIAHHNLIKKIKDKETRDKIKEYILDESLTLEKTTKIVNKILEQIGKEEIFRKEKKNIKIDIEIDGNSIVLTFNDPSYREIANNYILSILKDIEKEIIKETY